MMTDAPENVRSFDIGLFEDIELPEYQRVEMQVYPDGGEHFFGVDERGRHVVRFDALLKNFGHNIHDRPTPLPVQEALPLEYPIRPEAKGDKEFIDARQSYIDQTVTARRGLGLGKTMSLLFFTKMKYDYLRESSDHSANNGPAQRNVMDEVHFLAQETLSKQLSGEASNARSRFADRWLGSDYRKAVLSEQAHNLMGSAQQKYESAPAFIRPREFTDLYKEQTDTIVRNNRRKLMGAVVIGAASFSLGFKGVKALSKIIRSR